MAEIFTFPTRGTPPPARPALRTHEEIMNALLEATRNCTIVFQDGLTGSVCLTSELSNGNHVRHTDASGHVFREGIANTFERTVISQYVTSVAALNLLMKCSHLSEEEVGEIINPTALLEEIRLSFPAPNLKEAQ